MFNLKKYAESQATPQPVELIGGPCDGALLDLLPSVGEVQVPYRKPKKNEKSFSVNIGFALYRREIIGDERMRFIEYVGSW